MCGRACTGRTCSGAWRATPTSGARRCRGWAGGTQGLAGQHAPGTDSAPPARPALRCWPVRLLLFIHPRAFLLKMNHRALACAVPPGCSPPLLQNATTRLVTLETALATLALPKDLGTNPATGKLSCCPSPWSHRCVSRRNPWLAVHCAGLPGIKNGSTDPDMLCMPLCPRDVQGRA